MVHVSMWCAVELMCDVCGNVIYLGRPCHDHATIQWEINRAIDEAASADWLHVDGGSIVCAKCGMTAHGLVAQEKG